MDGERRRGLSWSVLCCASAAAVLPRIAQVVAASVPRTALGGVHYLRQIDATTKGEAASVHCEIMYDGSVILRQNVSGMGLYIASLVLDSVLRNTARVASEADRA